MTNTNINQRYAPIQDPLPPGASDNDIERLALNMRMTTNTRLPKDHVVIDDNEPNSEQGAPISVANTKQSDERSELQKLRAETVRVTVDLPAYVHKALKRKALEDDTTVRYLILAAINAEKSFQISVNDIDLVEDCRRSKHPKK